MKNGERPEWREGLASAYLGRTRELTAKGMLKEALAIIEVRRQLCPEAPPDPEHPGLLLRCGRTAEAVRIYRQTEQSLDRQARADLRCRLASLHLSGFSGLEEGLPPDDPVVTHGAPARAALEAWCRRDDEAAAQALAGIPFRPPYKDWAQILKALIKAPVDASGAQALLQRIPADSVFAPLADAAALALLPESAFPDALAQNGKAAQRFAAALRGWPQEREATCETLRRCGLQRARLAHARAALKRWPDRPVFELHAFEARHAERWWTTGAAEIERLESALIQARDDGDMRTVHRIGEVLQQVAFGPPLGPRMPAGFPEEPPQEFLHMIDELGAEGLLDLMRSIGAMDPEMKEMERLLGRERMLEAMEAMLNGAEPDDIPIDFSPTPRRKPR